MKSPRTTPARSERLRKSISLAFVLVLTCSQLLNCRSYFLGYPYAWSFSKEKPRASDLAGTYSIHKLRLPNSISDVDADAEIKMSADGAVELVSVPEFDKAGEKVVCSSSGSAKWSLREDGNSDWVVWFQDYRPLSKPGLQRCQLESSDFGGFVVLSRHAPYRLYMYIGDPDSDTGIEFGRADHR